MKARRLGLANVLFLATVAATSAVAVAAVTIACGDPPEAKLPPVAPTPSPAPVTLADASPSPSPSESDAGGAVGRLIEVKTPATFAEDVAFLGKHGAVHVLESAAGGRVALSAKYQGRVMTSAVDERGASFGWINRAFIAAGKTGTQFDNYGGEDRFWLGPEGGQFGLYFPPGAAFSFDAWQVPHAMQEGEWEMRDASKSRAVFTKVLNVTNWTGTTFTLQVERTVSLVTIPIPIPVPIPATAPKGDAGADAGGVRVVAYETVNKITNKGKLPWKKDTGLLSMWVLAMYAPSPDARVIIPFETKGVAAGTPIVNDAYFGKVAASRLVVHEDKGFMVFTADGKERGKIGLTQARAKPSLGSYSASAKLLTVVSYDKPKTTQPYVNSMWENQKAPYAGDIINSYNDGSPGPGKPPLGGFYEIETSSPGAELAPGQSLVHRHRTAHFVGEAAVLEPIAKKELGVSLVEATR